MGEYTEYIVGGGRKMSTVPPNQRIFIVQNSNHPAPRHTGDQNFSRGLLIRISFSSLFNTARKLCCRATPKVVPTCSYHVVPCRCILNCEPTAVPRRRAAVNVDVFFTMTLSRSLYLYVQQAGPQVVSILRQVCVLAFIPPQTNYDVPCASAYRPHHDLSTCTYTLVVGGSAYPQD